LSNIRSQINEAQVSQCQVPLSTTLWSAKHLWGMAVMCHFQALPGSFPACCDSGQDSSSMGTQVPSFLGQLVKASQSPDCMGAMMAGWGIVHFGLGGSFADLSSFPPASAPRTPGRWREGSGPHITLSGSRNTDCQRLWRQVNFQSCLT
jgi:hypothetical protein